MTDNKMNIDEIKKTIPHRYPFLLVDKVLNIDIQENLIIAQKNISINEYFFQGHFPDKPIMPGVLILEALAQTGAILIHKTGNYHNKLAVLLKITDAKFRQQVTPGDTLILKVQSIQLTSKGGKVYGQALVNEKVAAEAHITFAMTNQ